MVRACRVMRRTVLPVDDYPSSTHISPHHDGLHSDLHGGRAARSPCAAQEVRWKNVRVFLIFRTCQILRRGGDR